MIKQTLAAIGAVAMFGATGIALANDTQTPSPAPTTTEAPKQLDARSNDATQKPESATPEPARQ